MMTSVEDGPEPQQPCLAMATKPSSEPHSDASRWNGRRRHWLRLVSAIWRLVVAVVMGVSVFAAIFIFTPVGDWLSEQLVHIDPLEKADYIVVLGGHYERVVEAAQLYRDGWADKVILTSHGGDSDTMAWVAQGYGLPQEALVLDHSATRTHDHPRTVAEIYGVDPATSRFIIVTSAFHTLRARACFLKQGYNHVLMHGPNWLRGGKYAVGPRAWRTRASELWDFTCSAVAMTYYKFLGWV